MISTGRWCLLGLTVVLSSVPVFCQNPAQNFTQVVAVCAEAMLCGDCIKRDPICAWCEDIDFAGERCDSLANLQGRQCVNTSYPSGSVDITKQQALTDADQSPTGQAVQVSPQEVHVTLKVGEPQTVKLQVRLAEDYPLDLYYLMDLSFSLKPDLVNVAALGTALERELKQLTADLQLGFGAFVDKTTLPFTTNPDTCEHDACCPSDCDRPFSFRNQLALTKDTAQFSERVAALKISGSIDTPEGGLDALLQAIVCTNQIGWRARARRMIVYATDAGVHIAGDGKLAGISSPNDGLCYVDPNTMEYTRSAEQDFPSLGQINAALQENNIIPVFAVDQRKFDLYDNIRRIIAGARVGILASDSLNVVKLVTDSYKQITSEVNIMDNAPDNIRVSYTSYCKGRFFPIVTPGSSRCSDLLLQEVVSFDVEILATDCSPDGGQQRFTVRPFGFDESLTVVADVICNCDCESQGIRDPSMCSNGNGTVTCGQCKCDEGRYGSDCECDGESGSSDEDILQCLRPNSTNPTECSGRGLCICGQCVCSKSSIEGIEIYGQYCECDNDCEVYEGQICGGPERGECVCDRQTLERRCQCKPGYSGSNCGCITDTKECETLSGLLCNGWGECTCGRCECEAESPFTGDTCSECATCFGECAVFQDCVLCEVFEKGPFTDEQCDMCIAPIELRDDLISLNGTDIPLCAYLDDDNCTILYTYELQDDGTYKVLVQKEKVCRITGITNRRIQIDWHWILIGIIGGILVLGLLLIALIRLGIYFQERREYARFEKERKGANWNKLDNPLFKSSTSTFQNPMHGK